MKYLPVELHSLATSTSCGGLAILSVPDVEKFHSESRSCESTNERLCSVPAYQILLLKVKSSLCLTKHHAMKTYWEVEV
jgi:hypothetical protein